MIDTDDMPRTLMQAVRYFADRERCEQYMRSIKWPDGKIVCPVCGSDRIGEVKTRRLARCKECRKQISAKVGTIFEDSPLGLDKWFVSIWSVANCTNGISSYELARALGIRQPSAWHMLHRIRAAMEVGGLVKFDGPAEADATYVGGEARGRAVPFASVCCLIAIPKEKVNAKVAADKAARRKAAKKKK